MFDSIRITIGCTTGITRISMTEMIIIKITDVITTTIIIIG